MLDDPQEHRRYGIYRGTVSSVADPLNKHRVKVLVPQVFGTVETNWANICVDSPTTTVLSLNAPCWVMFEGGDPDYPVVMGTWRID